LGAKAVLKKGGERFIPVLLGTTPLWLWTGCMVGKLIAPGLLKIKTLWEIQANTAIYGSP
jgi:hypothetical protein